MTSKHAWLIGISILLSTSTALAESRIVAQLACVTSRFSTPLFSGEVELSSQSGDPTLYSGGALIEDNDELINSTTLELVIRRPRRELFLEGYSLVLVRSGQIEASSDYYCHLTPDRNCLRILPGAQFEFSAASERAGVRCTLSGAKFSR